MSRVHSDGDVARAADDAHAIGTVVQAQVAGHLDTRLKVPRTKLIAKPVPVTGFTFTRVSANSTPVLSILRTGRIRAIAAQEASGTTGIGRR